MIHGNKARLRELDNRNDAATALGHGLLDCPTSIRAQVAQLLLQHVTTRASRLDVIIAMDNQGIPPPETHRAEFETEVTANRERRRRQAESARLAREEHAELKLWKQGRSGRKEALANTARSSNEVRRENTGDDE